MELEIENMKKGLLYFILLTFFACNSFAEISRQEIYLDPNTLCILGGNFKKIKENSIKPILLIYSCKGQECYKVELFTKALDSSFQNGEFIMAFTSPIKDINDFNIKLEGEIEEKLQINIGSIFEIKPSTSILNNSGKKIKNKVSLNNINLVLTPKEGCLPLKFGMNRELIIEKLGEPDQQIGIHCLDYSSTLGLSLLVHPEKGLLALDCWGKNEISREGHFCGADFVGKFSNGIAIGSTRSEVEKNFGRGETTQTESITTLFYPEIGVAFTLEQDKVVHISMVAKLE